MQVESHRTLCSRTQNRCVIFTSPYSAVCWLLCRLWYSISLFGTVQVNCFASSSLKQTNLLFMTHKFQLLLSQLPGVDHTCIQDIHTSERLILVTKSIMHWAFTCLSSVYPGDMSHSMTSMPIRMPWMHVWCRQLHANSNLSEVPLFSVWHVVLCVVHEV